MRQFIITILLLLCTIVCFGYESAKFTDNLFNTGSHFSCQVTPVGSLTANNYYTTTYDYNPVSEQNKPFRSAPDDPYEPFETPIGDVPIIAVICFVCIYLFWYRKEKGDK